MTVPVYAPAFTVTLTKMVVRTDGVADLTSAPRQVDLTPYFGESSSIQTTKSCRGRENVGAFSLVLPDQLDPYIQDSFYAAIEPMDLIEIRASRYPDQYAGQPLPLIMRGFVSKVRRSQRIGENDAPERVVIVTGNDFGKLTSIYQILYEALWASESPFLTNFKLQATTGIDVSFLEVSEFMTQLITKVLNADIAQMNAFSQSQIQPVVIDATVPTGNGQVSITTSQSYAQGSIWGLIETYADQPWNEVFLWDNPADDRTHFVFRPTPYKDLQTGQFIMPGAVDPGLIMVDASTIISIDLSRTDANVANYFWVPAGQNSLQTLGSLTAAAIVNGEPFDLTYGNNSPKLYGTRKMEATSALLAPDVSTLAYLLPAGVQASALGSLLAWNTIRIEQLKAMNRDNVVFETGYYTMMGDEIYQIGQYLQVTVGALVSTSYITAVSHTIAPLTSWTTTVNVERGDGGVVRDKYQGNPFYAEGRTGPYSV